MPEAVEVEEFVKFLNKKLKGEMITYIHVMSGKYMKSRIPNLNILKMQLPLKVNNVCKKGKFIWFELENGWFIWNTLGLKGGWTDDEDNKYKRVKISTHDSHVYYYDMRNFGTIKIAQNGNELKTKLDSIAPDIMKIKLAEFKKRSLEYKEKHKNKPIVEVLNTQNAIVSGIGNYLRSEILYQSKINPFTKMDDITLRDITTIFRKAKLVIRKLMEHNYTFQVYMKKKTSKNEIVSTKKDSQKRTVHYVK